MLVIRSKPLRNVLKWAIPFILIPAVVLISGVFLREKLYLSVAMLTAVLSLILFFTGFEKKQTGSRRMVLTAVMTALCIVGRFIPICKPVTAIIILTALYLGREAGFLTGAMAALLSNFYFGQGPWTAFQMLAWGMTGWIAGAVADPLKKSRPLLLAFGFVSGIFYSMIMDIWTVLWYGECFDIGMYGAKMLTALPYMIIYAVSNLVFLWFMAKPFGEKLERIRIKYGV